MNLHLPAFSWGALQSRLKGMFNLNDPKWGRGEDKPDAGKPVEGGDTDLVAQAVRVDRSKSFCLDRVV